MENTSPLAMLTGTASCACTMRKHRAKLIAVTGGPGAGKTAVLEMASRTFCEHVAILPEAAGIVFGGGFPRHATEAGRRAAQRAIYWVQHELETLVIDEGQVAVAICDRGTVDGLAYWPGSPESYFQSFRSSQAAELTRYAAVIHLRTPTEHQGYDRSNALRVESAAEAAKIDARIAVAWAPHPRRFEIASSVDFVEKALSALKQIRDELPTCCHAHVPRTGPATDSNDPCDENAR